MSNFKIVNDSLNTHAIYTLFLSFLKHHNQSYHLIKIFNNNNNVCIPLNIFYMFLNKNLSARF